MITSSVRSGNSIYQYVCSLKVCCSVLFNIIIEEQHNIEWNDPKMQFR